ncbi:MAG: deoxyribodipyrimidine photo-lyase [Pseudomonadota bacterium]
MPSLIWMRRDLRLHDHAALATALAERAPVQPVFIFDTAILARFANRADRRLTFIAEALCRMDATLKARGGRMLVLHGVASEVMPKLAQAVQATGIFSAEDFEPDTIARDAQVKQALPATTRFVQLVDHLLHAPSRIVKGDGTAYKMFTPYYKVWRAALGPTDWAEYAVNDAGRYADAVALTAQAQAAGLRVLSLDGGPGALLRAVGYDYTPDPLWRVDDVPARLDAFISERLRNYATARDVLPIIGTSRLSPYLRFGLVSVRECMRAAEATGCGEKWISELGWREFYAAILYHFPQVVTQEFMPQYRDGAIAWSHDEGHAQALFTGRTGYPVVDAAVRELLATGTMHNRARMIVASFATKDLLLDWRLGEAFFAQHLMDYELASNNGGWQWAASTGTDAAPYFRVFNPVLQSRKFDPEGSYIRRYVPELRAMPDKHIHAPWESRLKPADYPAPIVDHRTAKERVVRLFKQAGQAKVD